MNKINLSRVSLLGILIIIFSCSLIYDLLITTSIEIISKCFAVAGLMLFGIVVTITVFFDNK